MINGMQLKDLIWDRIRQIEQYMDMNFRAFIEKEGLTIMQVRILTEIREHAHTVGSLGEAINLASGNASSACKKLEKLGYIQRVRDPKDERMVNLSLSDKGIAMLANLDAEIEVHIGDFIDAKKEKKLLDILDRMEELSMLLKDMHDATLRRK